MKKAIASLAAAASIGLFAGALSFIAPPSANAGVACGSRSFVVDSTRTEAYMMFHEGGNATFTDEYGRKSYGTWKWQGNDAVTYVNGIYQVWDNLRIQRCDWHY